MWIIGVWISFFLWPFRSRNIANKRITATQQNESVRSDKNTSNLIRCPFFFKEKPYEIKRNFLCINNEKKKHISVGSIKIYVYNNHE